MLIWWLLAFVQEHQNLLRQDKLLWALNGWQNLKRWFHLHMCINGGFHDDFPNPDQVLIPLKLFAELYLIEKEYMLKKKK